MHRFILCLNCSPTSFETVYCFICGRRRVAVARYRMICLVLVLLFYSLVHHCTLTNKAIGTSRRALLKHRRGGKVPNSVPSDCYLGLLQLLGLSSLTSFAEQSLLLQTSLFNLLPPTSVNKGFMTFPTEMAIGPESQMDVHLYNF